jgi:uncharacterized LabA/DUF88 family protein
MKTVVYVDGYNLYYGLLRQTHFKWLDLVSLFEQHVLDKSTDLVEVRYYTAPVLARMCDDDQSPQRQRLYIQALKKLHPKRIQVVEGKMVATTPFQRLVKPIEQAPHLERVQVYDFNEKKTDVNLASDLISGAWTGAYEQAVICSNDTDLEAALSTVRKYHPTIRLGVVAPVPNSDHRYISNDLKKHAHWSKALSMVHIANAQMPERIPASSIHCPKQWLPA